MQKTPHLKTLVIKIAILVQWIKFELCGLFVRKKGCSCQAYNLCFALVLKPCQQLKYMLIYIKIRFPLSYHIAVHMCVCANVLDFIMGLQLFKSFSSFCNKMNVSYVIPTKLKICTREDEVCWKFIAYIWAATGSERFCTGQ